MFFHENEKCPVCDNFFAPDDDIVVCPECATPHHRECYNKLGHCANAHKHKDGYEYTVSETVAESTETQENEGASGNNQSTKSENICRYCATAIDKSAPFCYNCGNKQDFPDYSGVESFVYISDDECETIEGKSVTDIKCAVKSNAERFYRKFRANKKVSWNWGAFFFGPYYLFFRKMYKQGIIAMAVNLIANLVINGLFVEEISAFTKLISSVDITKASSITPALIDEMTTVYENAMPAMILLSAVSLIINVIIALFADSMYRTKILTLIDKFDDDMQSGNNSIMLQMLQQQTNLSDEQMRANQLARAGGTNFFAPVIAYMVLNLITSFISNL